MTRTTSGHGKIDKLLNGGFIRGSNIMFLGRSFSGAYIFPLYFAARGTLEEECALIITIDKPYDVIIDIMKNFGAEMDNLIVIDLYSLPTGYVDFDFEHDGVIFLENRYNTETLLSHIINSANERFLYRVVMPLSSMLLYLPALEVSNLVERVSALVRKHKSLGFYTINTGMHKEEIIEMFMRLSDGSFEFSHRDGTSYFRVIGIRDAQTSGWISYSTSVKEIDIESFTLSKIR